MNAPDRISNEIERRLGRNMTPQERHVAMHAAEIATENAIARFDEARRGRRA